VNETPFPASTRALERWLPISLRVLLAICQLAAICLTRDLWRGRSGTGEAPNLPLFEGLEFAASRIDFFWPLLVSLGLVLAWPRVGVALHLGVLALAIACDQMRIQPEFLSVALLMLGTLTQHGPQLIARCHLISLWTFAGLHKLLSPEYLLDSGPRMWHNTVAGLSDRQAFLFSLLTALLELTLGALAVVPRTRRAVFPLAAALHGGILLSLVAQQWNTAVWPWNIAVIAAAFVLFRHWNEPLWQRGLATPAESTLPRTKFRWQIAAAVVLVYPALFYVGLADAYLAWCVYSSNGPAATLYRADDLADAGDLADLDPAAGEELQFAHYDELNVPFPPARRLFVQYFRRVGQPGDVLALDEPRLVVRWMHGRRKIFTREPDGRMNVAHPPR
jgi:hypothetical protein